MIFQQITDARLAQNAYLLGCEATHEAILIDPQRDLERYAAIADRHELKIVAAAETHIHADYLSGLRQCAHDWDVEVLVSGAGGEDWSYEWLKELPSRHRLLGDGDTIQVGTVHLRVLHTPGHTPEHLTFLVTDFTRQPAAPFAVITGDFVFVGDVGRPDLLESAVGQAGTMRHSARRLYESLQRFRALDPSLQLWPGHSAGTVCGRALGSAPSSYVGDELATNPSLRAASEEDAFVDFIVLDQPEPPPYFARMKRENRDGPRLLSGYPTPQRLTPGMVEHVVSQTDTVVLDCRSWSEFSAGHLPGALYTPLNASFTTTIGSYVMPHERIVAVCEENQIGEVVTECIRIGLDNVEAWLTPQDLSRHASAVGALRMTRCVTMTDLPARPAAVGITLLDVRRSAELRETGRIEGSLNLPHTQIRIRHTELPGGQRLHVFCRTGNRSGYASACLERLGYDVVYVGGGIVQWLELNRPVMHTPLPVAVAIR